MWTAGRNRYARIPPKVRTGAAVLAVAFVGMLLGLQVGGRVDAQIGPFDVQLAAQPTLTGDSQLQIPPLGAITLDSHDGPLRLTARLDRLDEGKTRTLLSDPRGIERVSDDAIGEVERAVRDVALRAALSALLGAALLGLVVFRSWRQAAATAGLALAVLAGTGVLTAATWNPGSIREPRYEGLLTNVPAVVGDARAIYARYGEYRGELIRILTNMSRVYTNLSTLPTYQPDPSTIRVLHVTDLHLNPTSFPVIRTIAEQFQVRMVVDTGDITDWGSNQENPYLQNIATIKVPYVFVRGNHDSVFTAAAVRRNPNAIVLEDEVQVIGGLTIAGIGSARFTPDKSEGDTAKDEESARIAGTRLARTVAAYNQTHVLEADLALVHEPVAAEELAGAAPLVLAGHTHQRTVRALDDDTTLRVEGSTGARGLSGLGEESPTALQMSVLYFSPQGDLQAYDEITVSGAGQSKIELKRTIVPPADATAGGD
ncbi:MAG TPA: metallophosphoesterase [Cryptosporangiaceae bacterium]|nr:metallophosphoesterase [Cryptosporangiaceae bacterium]